MAQPLNFALKASNAAFVGPVNQARGAIRGIKAEASAATSTIGGMIGKLAGIGAAVGGIAGVMATLKKAVKGAADMESTTVAFETLVGGADKAKTVLKQLSQLAADTPFEFPELANAGRMLIAFGESSDKVTETLRRIGDISSGVQAPIGEIAEIYGKARVQGNLWAEDINQMTGRGIPVITEMAKILGVQQDKVKKLGEQGGITFPLLDQAFRNLTGSGGKFAGMMAKQSQTMNGLWSTLLDNVNAMFRTIGQPINDAIRPLLKQAIGYADKLGQGVKYVAAIIQGAFDGGTLGNLIGAGLQAGVVKALQFLSGAIPSVVKAFDTIQASMAGGVSAMLAAFAGGAGAGIGKMLSGVGRLFNAELIQGVSTFVPYFTSAIKNALLGAFDAITNALHLSVPKLAGPDDAGVMQRLAEGMKIEGIGELKQGLADFQKALGGSGAVANLGKAMGEANANATVGLSNLIEGKVKTGVKDGALGGFIDAMDSVAPGIAAAVAKATGAGAKKAKGAKGAADEDGDGIVSNREQRKAALEKARATRRANSIKGYSEKGRGLEAYKGLNALDTINERNKATFDFGGNEGKRDVGFGRKNPGFAGGTPQAATPPPGINRNTLPGFLKQLQPIKPATPLLDKFKALQGKPIGSAFKQPNKTLDTPGKSTKRERERAEAARQAGQAKPRWDVVASIDQTLKTLKVA